MIGNDGKISSFLLLPKLIVHLGEDDVKGVYGRIG